MPAERTTDERVRPKQTARELLPEAHPGARGTEPLDPRQPRARLRGDPGCGLGGGVAGDGRVRGRDGVAGMATAVVGTSGCGSFHVAICAEYDALPDGRARLRAQHHRGAAVGAALALAAVADELGLRVTVLGTPAEEGGGGKILLLEAGAFDGVHAAMMVHPGPDDIAEPRDHRASSSSTVTYTGREAHAAGVPELGINAADALIVAQAAIGLLRQHLQPDRPRPRHRHQGRRRAEHRPGRTRPAASWCGRTTRERPRRC